MVTVQVSEVSDLQEYRDLFRTERLASVRIPPHAYQQKTRQGRME